VGGQLVDRGGDAGRWAWQPGYREWAPPRPLRASVACLWTTVVPASGEQATLVLPDACSDLIWQRGTGVFVAGPDTGPWRSALPAGTVLAGVRFAPGAGGPALGMPLSDLLNQRVDVTDLGRGLAPVLARRVPGTLPPAMALRQLVDCAGGMVAERPADRLVTEAARLLGRPRTPVDDVAARLGVGERQLLRRSRAAVGYGPATLRRVLRFRRFVSRVDAGEGGQDGSRRPGGRPGGLLGPDGPDLARVAADTGYADQAHLTRECVRLAGLPPAALAAQRRPGPR
jgi:AraC-like DNA-binding protein